MSGVRNAIVKCSIAGAVMVSAQMSAPATKATELNADFVLNEMNMDQRVSYIHGVVEGLAYSRFLRDRPDETGMLCIYEWYNNEFEEKWAKTKLWFARHADKPVGVLLYILIKQECGE